MIDLNSFERAARRRPRLTTVVAVSGSTQAAALLEQAAHDVRLTIDLDNRLIAGPDWALLVMDERVAQAASEVGDALQAKASDELPNAVAVTASASFVRAAWTGPAVVLRIHPGPDAEHIPARWIRRMIGEIDAATGRVLVAGCELPSSVAVAEVMEAVVRAGWAADIADRDFARVITASGGRRPLLGVVSHFSSVTEVDDLVARIDALVTSLGDIGYASISIESDFSRILLGRGYGITAWQSALPAEEVEARLWELVPDAFAVQYLTYRHIAKAPELADLAKSVGDGLWRYELGAPVDWLPPNADLPIRKRGWQALRPLLP